MLFYLQKKLKVAKAVPNETHGYKLLTAQNELNITSLTCYMPDHVPVH